MMKRMKASAWLLSCFVCGAIAPVNALAATDAETIAALQAQLAELTSRLDALESRNRIPVDDYKTPPAAAPTAPSDSWVDRIKLKGDFRYRQDSIDAEFADSKRHRQRIRARPAITAEINDRVEVGFGLATGGDNPTSSNQTLGDSFSRKSIGLDLAYVDWSTPVEGLSLMGGKYKNPLHRAGDTGLLWDSDLRPEGFLAAYERGGIKLLGTLNWVSESSSKDTLVYGGQAGWTTSLGDSAKLLIGAGYYDLGSVSGREVPFDGDPRGNSVDGQNRYLYGYEELELFGELTFDIGSNPTELYFNYVENLDAPEFDTGWVAGANMSFRHGSRSWSLGYAYQDLEADAVFAMFTDSDFIGGGTDGKGHILRGSYSLTRNISFGGTLFLNERGENNTGITEDYNRLLLDVEFKY